METLLFGTKDKHIPQQVAQQYEARQTNSASKRFFQELLDRLFNQIVSEACSNKDDINILDVATGTGKIPLILANGQRKIFGVDISWEMIKIAREKVKQANLKNIYFQVGNSLSLPFSNSSFDVITCVAFFGSFPKHMWSPVVQEMHRVLKSDGTAIIQLYNFLHGILQKAISGKRKHSCYPLEDRQLFSNYKIIKRIGMYLPGTYSVIEANKSVGKVMLQLSKTFPFKYLCRVIIYVCRKM